MSDRDDFTADAAELIRRFPANDLGEAEQKYLSWVHGQIKAARREGAREALENVKNHLRPIDLDGLHIDAHDVHRSMIHCINQALADLDKERT